VQESAKMVDGGESRVDGKAGAFRYSCCTPPAVECLGSCGTAPMMQVNNYYEENLDNKKIDELIESYKTDK